MTKAMPVEDFRHKDLDLFDKLPPDVRQAVNYNYKKISAWGVYHALYCRHVRAAIRQKMARYIRMNGTYPTCRCSQVKVETGSQGDIR